LRALAIIPAKGQSSGLPDKNRKMLCGKMLFQWSVEQAEQAEMVDRIIVSSDAPDILYHAGKHAVQRPEHLAMPDTSTEAVIAHHLNLLSPDDMPDIVVLLQPTSPIRKAEDIDAAVRWIKGNAYDSVLSVVPTHRFMWRKLGAHGLSDNYDMAKRPRRQDFGGRFMETGSIYAFKTAGFMVNQNRLFGRIGLIITDYWSAWEIDEQEDWDLVEFALNKKLAAAPNRV
jgi:CMP-N,N'-diacetyllegionaminic acid synthase